MNETEQQQSALRIIYDVVIGISNYATAFFLPVVIVIGLFGNSATVVVYQLKAKVRSRQGVYLSLIAVCDSCGLIVIGILQLFVPSGIGFVTNYNIYFDLTQRSDVACRVMRYLENLCYINSSAMFLMMVMDRVLAMHFPFKFQTLTHKFAAFVGLVTFCVSAVLTIPMAIVYQMVDMDYGPRECFMALDTGASLEGALFFMYSVLLYEPPMLTFFSILIANIFLIVKVRKILSNRSMLSSGGAEKDAEKDAVRKSMYTIYLSAVLILCSIPLIIASITTLVVLIVPVYSDQVSEFFVMHSIFSLADIGRIMIMVNQSVNWLVLLWKSEEFREAFCEIFCCRRRGKLQRRNIGMAATR